MAILNQIFSSTNGLRVLLLISFFGILGLSAEAQNKRPKVGLVLSGGGAKGVAHIGVLKAMEKAGLRPDYITGTSMGSIIGGLYAAGYTADELEELVLNIDWDEVLTDKIPFNDISFPEKEFSSRYLLEFYLKNKKIQLPKGLIEGQPLMEYFSKLTIDVQGIDDFNHLPIPFACIGADIVNGETVLLNSGSLAQSMRASMALPSIFAPVKLNGRLLVDGGLLRNLPADEVIAMGADIVIGVLVAADLHSEESLNSALDIIVQAAFIKSAFDTREQIPKCDYLITPELAEFSTGSFSESHEIFERGVAAGKAYYPIFKKLSDSLNQLGPQPALNRPKRLKHIRITEVELSGLVDSDSIFVRSQLNIEDGSEIGVNQIQEGIDQLTGSLLFESIYYELSPSHRDSSFKLVVHLKERPLKELRFSYHYDTYNKGGILLNGTFRNVFWKNNRVILEADLAFFPRLTFDYLQYINKKKSWAFQLNSYLHSNEIPESDPDGTTNSTFTANRFNVESKLQSFNFGNSAIGIFSGWNSNSFKPKIANTSERLITRVDYSQIEFGVFFSHNSLNRRYFPTKGNIVETRFSFLKADQASIEILDSITFRASEIGDLFYTKTIHEFEIDVTPIFPLSSSVSMLNRLKIRLSDLPSNAINFSAFDYIGGGQAKYANTTNYYGVAANEYTSANYIYAYTGLQIEVRDNFFTTVYFNYLESSRLVQEINEKAELGKFGDRTARFAYGAELGYLSPIGPFKVGVAKDHFRDLPITYLSVGFYY